MKILDEKETLLEELKEHVNTLCMIIEDILPHKHFKDMESISYKFLLVEFADDEIMFEQVDNLIGYAQCIKDIFKLCWETETETERTIQSIQDCKYRLKKLERGE